MEEEAEEKVVVVVVVVRIWVALQQCGVVVVGEVSFERCDICHSSWSSLQERRR